MIIYFISHLFSPFGLRFQLPTSLFELRRDKSTQLDGRAGGFHLLINKWIHLLASTISFFSDASHLRIGLMFSFLWHTKKISSTRSRAIPPRSAPARKPIHRAGRVLITISSGFFSIKPAVALFSCYPPGCFVIGCLPTMPALMGYPG